MQNGTFTITGDELKDIHNGLCYLHQYVDSLNAVIKDDLMKGINDQISLIERGIAGVRQQEDAMYEAANAMQSELGLKHSVISMNIPDFDAVPYPNATTLVCNNHKMPIHPWATWKDLFKAVDTLIAQSGDDYHVFVENIYEGGDEEHISESHRGKVLFVVTGS